VNLKEAFSFSSLIMTLNMESGLSVLSRLCTRPSIYGYLGPGLGQPSQQVTKIRCQGPKDEDMVDVVTGYCLELISNLILPGKISEVSLGGCEAGLILIDCDHHLKVKLIANILQNKVASAALQHMKEMKEQGISREERNKRRINSTLQWEAVKGSLERILIMEVFTPDQLEISILSLQNVLMDNIRISAVLIAGVNSFFHQVRGETGISHAAYMKKVLNHINVGCKDTSEELKILYLEHNLFGENNVLEKNENSSSDIVIEKLETNYSATFRGRKLLFSLNSCCQVVWAGA